MQSEISELKIGIIDVTNHNSLFHQSTDSADIGFYVQIKGYEAEAVDLQILASQRPPAEPVA